MQGGRRAPTVVPPPTPLQTMKTPPASYLLKEAAGLASGASKPGHASVGEVRASDVVSIARVKAADVPHIPLASVARSVAATARSMGIKVVE